jgi:multiple sugar transport system substrate-binding protein
MIILSSGNGFFYKNGKPDLKTPGIETAFNWALKFRKAKLDAGAEDFSDTWASIIRSGKLVFYFSGAWLATRIHDATGLPEEDVKKFRIAGIPALEKGGAPMQYSFGGSYLAIPSQSKNKAAAWEFIKDFTMYNSSLYKQNLPAYIPPLTNDYDFGLSGCLGPGYWPEAKKIMMSNASQMHPAYANRYDRAALDILNSALDDVLSGHTGIDSAIGSAQKKLEQALNNPEL